MLSSSTLLQQMKNTQSRWNIYYTSVQYSVTRLMIPPAPSPALIEVNISIANRIGATPHFDKHKPHKCTSLCALPQQGRSNLAGCHTALAWDSLGMSSVRKENSHNSKAVGSKTLPMCSGWPADWNEQRASLCLFVHALSSPHLSVNCFDLFVYFLLRNLRSCCAKNDFWIAASSKH